MYRQISDYRSPEAIHSHTDDITQVTLQTGIEMLFGFESKFIQYLLAEAMNRQDISFIHHQQFCAQPVFQPICICCLLYQCCDQIICNRQSATGIISHLDKMTDTLLQLCNSKSGKGYNQLLGNSDLLLNDQAQDQYGYRIGFTGTGTGFHEILSLQRNLPYIKNLMLFFHTRIRVKYIVLSNPESLKIRPLAAPGLYIQKHAAHIRHNRLHG
ncbi:hypothetical protein D3C72_568040 [compost metagenome]